MKLSIFWHRRDLRLFDNAGLYQALKNSKFPVQSIFIFDTDILDKLEDKKDARVQFIRDELERLNKQLANKGSTIKVLYGKPVTVWSQLMKQFDIQEVYSNRDYETYAIDRDQKVASLLMEKSIPFYSFKDHVIFEQDEVTKADGLPYTVFTPYKRRWLEKLHSNYWNEEEDSYFLKPYPNEKYESNYYKAEYEEVLSLNQIGFEKSDIPIPDRMIIQQVIRDYSKNRNFPAIDGTSKLGIHFRFGTISIRQKANKALALDDTYLSELVWRDFYSQILNHFPHVEQNAFRAKYDQIPWSNDEKRFEAWCEGITGYPMVDAGMRELNKTGHMHNRVRMVVASFLTKHLLIDWRWGEAYFANKLLDFDLASNNGGWQWAAGCGTDAAPYFRIFNPESQLKKFDKDLIYVKKWIPEYGTDNYPEPIIEHKWARERCLKTYKEALKKVE